MKRQSIVYTWVLEFALMLALMALMCVTLTFSVRQLLLQEYESITASQQDNAEASLNTYFAQLRSQTLEVAGDSSVKYFALLPTPQIADNYYLVTAQSQLKNLSPASVADDTMVYFKNIGKGLTDATILNREDCAAELFGASDEDTLAQFSRLLAQPALNELVVLECGGKVTALMITSVPTAGRSVKAMILQVVDLQALQDIITAQATLDDATTVLVDAQGKAVCSTGDPALAQRLAAQHASLGDADRLTVDGQQYWLRQKRLAEVDWTVVTAAPMENIVRKSSWFLRQSLACLVVFLFLGLLISVFLIHRNYQPVKQLTDRLPKRGDSGGNEYEQIGSAFQAVQSDLEALKLLQKKQRATLQREWLENAMAYETVADQPHRAEILASLGIQPDRDWFQLILLGSEDELDSIDLTLDENAHVLLVHPHGAAVLCLAAPNPAALAACAKQVCSLLESTGMPYYCGEACHDPARLHPEFMALCERSTAADTAAPPNSAAGLRIPMSRTDDILQLVFSGRGEEACETLRQTVQHITAGQPFSVYVARMYYTDFLLHLLNAVPRDDACTEVQQAVVETSRALQRAITNTELLELTETLLGAAAAKYVPAPQAAQPDFLARITQCVQQHFREHDFNVSRMADLLGVSVPYLSKYFKEHTGVNLLSYLNGVRIDYAKQLIAEQRLSVAAAADQAGFENINTFIRLFKKYVGDTPGNYSKQ